MSRPKVIDVLRTYLPAHLAEYPHQSDARQRAIWAIENCRTPTMGGHAYQCDDCGDWEYTAHSCNHRSCPQCGAAATTKWIERELDKRVAATYYMVTFTLPSELRDLFFGENAKSAYDLFFSATRRALSEKLAEEPDFAAETNGFTGILHTWNQRLQFHPHIHYIVPGAGIDADGQVVTTRYDKYLVNIHRLKGAFRQYIGEGLQELGWQVDPSIWGKQWGIDIKTFGDGQNVIKYLGRYVCRTAITDSRIISTDQATGTVTYTWKDRSDPSNVVTRRDTIPGAEFVARYLRHVLPKGLRAIRYYGYCHPSGKKKRMRIAFHTGIALDQIMAGIQASSTADIFAAPPSGTPKCTCCERPMRRVASIPPQPRPKTKQTRSAGPPEKPKRRMPSTPIQGSLSALTTLHPPPV